MDVFLWILIIHCASVIFCTIKMKKVVNVLLPALVKDMASTGEIPMDLMKEVDNINEVTDRIFRVVCQVPLLNLLWTYSIYKIIKVIRLNLYRIEAINEANETINEVNEAINEAINEAKEALKDKDSKMNSKG